MSDNIFKIDNDNYIERVSLLLETYHWIYDYKVTDFFIDKPYDFMDDEVIRKVIFISF